MNIFSGVSTLDPAFSKDQSSIWLTHQIFNGLVKLDQNLLPIPDIANQWEISDSGKTYTFHLKKGIFFHQHPIWNHGNRFVTASDFVYSFQRIINPKIASSGAWIFNDRVDSIQPFSAPNDSTFIIHLKSPFAPFLGLLTMPYASVVPMELAENPNFGNNPIGTGPFQVFAYGPGEALILHKNPRYFEFDSVGNALPYLDAVKVTFIPDRSSEFISFLAGDLDFINGIDASYKDKLLDKYGNLQPHLTASINYLKSPYLNTEYLGLYLDSGQNRAYLNPRVRQAMACGFDRVAMLKYLRNNVGIPGTSGIIPPGLSGFDSTTFNFHSFNPNKAKKLLLEAGYPQGKGLPKLKLLTNNTYLDLCLFAQDAWKKLGIPIEVESMPPSQLRKAIKSGQANFFRASWIADYPDAENYLGLFCTSNFAPQGPNYTHFNNQKFDELFQIIGKESNINDRITAIKSMNKIIMDQSPIIVLYYDQAVRFVHNNWIGLEPNAINQLELTRVHQRIDP